jgi:hypothetical protein
MHDHDRTPRDFIRDTRTDEGTGGKSIAFFIGLALIGFIIYVILATPSQDPTGGITRSAPPPPTSAPQNAPVPPPK